MVCLRYGRSVSEAANHVTMLRALRPLEVKDGGKGTKVKRERKHQERGHHDSTLPTKCREKATKSPTQQLEPIWLRIFIYQFQ